MALSTADRYRVSMKRPHDFGYALYQPKPFTRLCPVKVGYLDEYQNWHPLFDLEKPDDIAAEGYTPFILPRRSVPDAGQWGPCLSTTTVDTPVDISARGTLQALGLPAEVTAVVQYRTFTDFGAVLMCDDKVVSEGFDVRNPFLEWLKQNSGRLLANYPDVKRYGLCAVTWTYSATDIHIKTWTDTDTRVTVGFVSKADPFAHGGVQTSWARSQSSSGWFSWNDQKRVIFFTGVKITFGFFGVNEQQERGWRGVKKDSCFLVTDSALDESCEAEVEIFGDDWQEIKMATDENA
ncbi:hypothetical protein X797_010875 [Metarhizium robertsii]|uniref:Uncharacterized protein n=2 Tax=Metarhizium robertsii TaxID=568076 RepID=E9FAC1_METRA|nr:uncharacterized protein MAA_09220 [Metarhizium robertsii ARSEF 23]EFY95271.1 hypothetical protein MAA_09220 [Metarhizium robertsii ARSEF 23]EXU96064.1 hypothetical protein X797_010875 [Metarhizium robertsii]